MFNLFAFTLYHVKVIIYNQFVFDKRFLKINPVKAAHLAPNVHENRFVEGAERVSHQAEYADAVEKADASKIGFRDQAFRIQPAAAGSDVIDAGLHDSAEGLPPRCRFKVFQPGTVHFMLQAVHGVIQVFVGHQLRQLTKGIFEGLRFVQTVGLRQMIDDQPVVPAGHLPDIRFFALEYSMGIADVEHIAELCRLHSVVDQRDALCAAIDPAVHLLVPDFKGCAGRSIRALRVDQQLVGKVISVHAGSRIEKFHPVPRRADNPFRMRQRQIADIAQFGQGAPPPSSQP